MAWPLKVETDEPGRRLVLAAEVPSVSKGLLAGIAGFLVVAVAIPTLGMAAFELFEQGVSTHALIGVALGGLYPAATAVGLVMMARRVRTINRLAIDRASGRIEIHEFRLLPGDGAAEIIRVGELQTLSVRSTTRFHGRTRELPGGAGDDARNLALTLRLSFRGGARPTRELQLSVDGLDRLDEGSDLALRLASAAGLSQQRVVSSDPRAIEMEFSAAPAPGSASLVESLPPADYKLGRVSVEAQAIAKKEAIAAFDPSSFESDYKLEIWDPGREVRFQKPRGLAAIGCAPGLLFFLTMPVVFVAALISAPAHTPAEVGARLLGAGVFGLFGLLPAGLSLLIVMTSAAKTVVIDWTERRLKRRRPFSRASYGFSELHAIKLTCIKATSEHSTSYRCRLSVLLKTPGDRPQAPRSVEIASTRSFSEPDSPYRMALPLATELARALGLPRDVTEETH